MGWNNWIRTVEVEPSLYAADFAHLGDQIDVLLRAGVPRLPLRRRRRALRRADHDRPDRPAVDLADRSTRPAARRLSPDGDDPSSTSRADRASRRRQRHGPLRGLPRPARGRARGACARPPGRPRVQAGDERRIRSARSDRVGRRHGPLHEHRARLLGSGVHAGGIRPRSAPCGSLLPADVPVQVDGGIGPENIEAVREAGATLFVAGTSIFGREDLPRAYRRLLEEFA